MGKVLRRVFYIRYTGVIRYIDMKKEHT